MTTHTAEAQTETNRALVRRLYEACINPGRLDALNEIIGDDYVGPAGDRGPAGFRATLAELRQGFPDITFTIDDVVADPHKVAVRWRWQATHAGPFRTFPPSGRLVTNTGIAIYEIRDGRIVRAWLETDRLGALQQIGAIK
jgi:steroid delta-isomerase-like uncharacterized protein